jgi:hypothetical protein
MFEKTDTTGMVVARLSVLSGKNDKFVGRTPASECHFSLASSDPFAKQFATKGI